MKILSWNIRGLNTRRKQTLLKDRIKKEQPDMLVVEPDYLPDSEVLAFSHVYTP
jgi:exonuclease III